MKVSGMYKFHMKTRDVGIMNALQNQEANANKGTKLGARRGDRHIEPMDRHGQEDLRALAQYSQL